MTRSTRNFLTGSAVIVALGVGTGLVAYYNGSLPGAMVRTGEAELAYLPADSAAVGYANVREIMTSDFRQKLRQVLPTGEELETFKNELGVDIERDIDTVAAAYLGGLPALGQALVVLRGRFNREQIESVAARHGAKPEDYKGRRLLMMADPGGPMGQGAGHPVACLAFLEDGLVALGEGRAIKRAIDTRESGDDVRKNAELAHLMADVRTDGNAWFVGRVGAMVEQSGLPAEIREHIPAVQVFAASAHVNGGIRGAVRAEARDDQAAEQLRDVVRGLLATGKLMGGDDPKVTSMLNSLQLIGKGKVVGLTFTAPAELLDILNGVAAAHNLHGGSGIRK